MVKQIAQKTNESLGKLGKKNRRNVARVDTNNGLFYLGEFNNSHRPSFVNSGIIINDGARESRGRLLVRSLAHFSPPARM